MTIQADTQTEGRIEGAVLSTILLDRDGKTALSELAEECPTPLHRWFSVRNNQVIALGLDAVLRGEIALDHPAVPTYLAGLPFLAAIELLRGEKVPKWEAPEFADSALANIGGWNGYGDATDERYFATRSGHKATCKCLRSLADKRNAIALLRETAMAVQKCGLNEGPATVLGDLSAKLHAICHVNGAGTIGDFLGRALKEGERVAGLRLQGTDLRPTWGIRELDILCPLHPGRLYVLSAPPGVGKTSLALQSALATATAAGRQSVAFASLEMSGADLATVLAARTLGIPRRAIEQGDYREASDFPRLFALAEEWRQAGTFMVRDVEGLAKQSAGSLVAWFTNRSLLPDSRLALCVVDYLGLVEPDQTRDTEAQALGRITRSLKLAAVGLNVPVLLLAQLNREGRKELRDKSGVVRGAPEPRLADLRGSGCIEQDGDAVIFLHRPNPPDGGEIWTRAIVAKHRAGAIGEMDLWFQPKTQTFMPPRPMVGDLSPPPDYNEPG